MAIIIFDLSLISEFLVETQFFMVQIQLGILNQWYEIVFQMI